MKKLMMALALLLITTKFATAQCNKTIKWFTNKAEILDATGSVVETQDDEAVLEMGEKNVVVSIAGKQGVMHGVILESTCEWTKAFRQGKSVLKVEMTDSDGDKEIAEFTIEGKEDKITILLKSPNHPQKQARLIVYKHEVVE